MNIHSKGGVLRRHEEILRIIREEKLGSQDELLAALRKRGFRVTQPTLSRDLREIGVARSPGGYVAPGDLAGVTDITTFTSRELREDRLARLVRASVKSAEAAGNLVIIRTPAAAAQPVASALDAAPFDGVLGTVGGDDTIFVALRTAADAGVFARHLQQLAGITSARRRAR